MSESPDAPESESRLFNTSLSRGLTVLLAFAHGKREMNLRELSEATGLTKSAIQRFTFTLEALGFLLKSPDNKKYSLSPKCLALGYGYLQSNPLIDLANAYLADLNRKCEETVNLSVPDGTDMVYVARFPSQKHVAIHMPVGRRLPMYCTAAGRAYLSALPPAEVDELLEASTLTTYTPNTLTDKSQILAVIDEARRDGYSWANQEFFRGDINLGVAIKNAHGRPVGAINISLPTSRWSLESGRQQIAPVLLETIRAISPTMRG